MRTGRFRQVETLLEEALHPGRSILVGFVGLVGLVGLVAGTACSASPTREDAERWSNDLAPTLNAVEDRVVRAIEALPLTSAPKPECDVLTDPHEINRCVQARSDWYTAASASQAQFPPEVLGPLLDEHPSLVGVRVTYIKVDEAKPEQIYELGSIGNVFGPNKRGSVSPDNGITRDGRSYGWGLGQTAVAFGDGPTYGSSDYAPMLSMATLKELGSIHVTLRVVVLSEGETDAEWRKAWRESLARDHP